MISYVSKLIFSIKSQKSWIVILCMYIQPRGGGGIHICFLISFNKIIYLSWKIKYVDNGIIQFTPVLARTDQRQPHKRSLFHCIPQCKGLLVIYFKRCFQRSKRPDTVKGQEGYTEIFEILFNYIWLVTVAF